MTFVAVPPTVVTTTSTDAALTRAGALTVSDVSDATTTWVPATPSKVTDATSTKSVPAMVTVVPAVSGPTAGVIVVMVDQGWRQG